MKVEYWAVRVLMHAGPKHGPMRLSENDDDAQIPAHVRQRIDAGELACIPPHWDIAEAVAGPFVTEDECQESCKQLRRDNPGADIRCLLAAEGV